MTAKVEIRYARGGDPSVPHIVTVEFLMKWNTWTIDVNPATSPRRGHPIRIQQVANLQQARLTADRLAEVIRTDGKLTEDAQVVKLKP